MELGVINLSNLGGSVVSSLIYSKRPNASLLHLRRRRHKPPREHHRLGTHRVPNPLQRRHHHQVGHFPLQYGLLHHPDYRQKYEANLKRDLPTSQPPVKGGEGGCSRFLGIRKGRRTTRRNPRQLRIPIRIQRAQTHSEPRPPAQLARREDEALQRQNADYLQYFLTLDGIHHKSLTTASAPVPHWSG